MEDALDDYKESYFDDVLKDLICKSLAGCNPMVGENPKAILLGGQSGAGKTTLHDIFREELNDNVIVVNGDVYRRYHPSFHELQARYGKECVDHTAKWSGKMTEALIDCFSSLKYNLIVEGTLRTSEVPLRSASLLRERGYGVSLALMAVKPEISLISCQLRCEQMRLAGTTPRATDPECHRKMVSQIVENLSVLEDSGAFEEVYLYTRSRECLHPIEASSIKASDVLSNVLFGEWSDEERGHYSKLKARLETLQAL